MIEWEMTYTENRETYSIAIVTAPTYTMAVLEFILRFPNCECTRVKEKTYEG